MVLEYTDAISEIRSATLEDRIQLNALLHFEAYVHRHMDWRKPIDWIGSNPFLVAEDEEKQIIATLACPPDPPETAWIRAFASTSKTVSVDTVWQTLWRTASASLQNQQVKRAVSVVLDDWFRRLLEESGFAHACDVVVLSWENNLAPLPAPKFQGHIREVANTDLDAIQDIDNRSFETLWQNSLKCVELAYKQSVIATVVEDEQGVVGYQMSTYNPLGGHLARLAVHPRAQGQGIGYALVHDLLERFKKRGALQVTVNTQNNNLGSLALYKKANFHLNGEFYPIYQATF